MDPVSPASPAAEAIAMLQAAVNHARKQFDESLWQVPEADLPTVLDQVHALDAQLAALKLSVVRELDTRGVPTAVGASSLTSYLHQRLRLSPGQARETAHLSEALATRNADTGAALAAGRIGYEQAKAISKTLDGLPKNTTPEQRDWSQEFLLRKADLFDARDLRRLGTYLDEVIDPDGTPRPRRRRPHQTRPAHQGQPRRHPDPALDRHRREHRLRQSRHRSPGQTATRRGRRTRPPPSPRTPRRRHGRHHAPGPGRRHPRPLPRRPAPPAGHLHRRSHARRTRRTPGAHLHRGLHLPLRAATPALRRLAHRDPGRRTRRPAQSRAHQTHRHPRPMDRPAGPRRRLRLPRLHPPRAQLPGPPPRETNRDHPLTRQGHFPEWSHDGATDLDKMGLFCTVHHHFLHDKGWTARLGPDGHVDVIPPAWIDPLQRPRRNWHWRRQRDPANAQPADRGP